MPRVSRRTCLQSPLSLLAAGGAAHATAPAPGKPGIRLALIMAPGQTRNMRLARQCGVNHAVANVNATLSAVPRARYLETLQGITAEFKAAGLVISAVESHPVPAEKIKLGLPGRDEEIENYLAAIDALGKVGIPVLCYNFMAGLGWYRTRVNVAGRGGALVSEFNFDAAAKQGLTEWGQVSEEKIWQNLEYFLKAVIPAAEKANVKMALHPDDPPLSPLRGIGRILTSAANFRRVLKIVPSPVNGITYCQANFVAMREDVYALAKEWCAQKKIFFVHYRDIEGAAQNFRETFHDNGSTDMPRIMKIYHDGGFDGPMRPDHAPTMEGESNAQPGYAILGKIFAFGYMKGILDTHRIPYL